MKTILWSTIVEAVRRICIEAAINLPQDIQSALQEARDTEKSPRGKAILNQCIDNASIAVTDSLPICQDTGTAVFFVSVGSEVQISGGSLPEAIQEGTRQGYRDGYLRKSIVIDPLFDRKNSGDNTPAIIHYDLVPGDTLSITVLPKGGGCENMSALAMLKPSDGQQGIIDFVTRTIEAAGGNPCPPVIAGIGIGGTADKASLLAKKALLRKVGSSHPDERYGAFEKLLLERINATGVGPQGLGGNVTALAVHIETFPCHIASMPVALNLNCHAARKGHIEL